MKEIIIADKIILDNPKECGIIYCNLNIVNERNQLSAEDVGSFMLFSEKRSRFYGNSTSGTH